MGKRIMCGFEVAFDAVAGWLSSYGGQDSPADIQRGVFAGEVGVPRLLHLFAKRIAARVGSFPAILSKPFPGRLR